MEAFRVSMSPPPPPEEPSEKTDVVDGWEILEHTYRGSGIVAGEAYPTLVGMARAKELGGSRYLFMYLFLHDGGDHMELRMEANGEQVARRSAVVKVDGEVLSDMLFEPCNTSVVSDTRRKDEIRPGTAHLLDHDEGVMTVAVTDSVVVAGAVRQYDRDVLRVPLRGYRAAADRLAAKARRVWEVSLHGYSPPEFVPGMDPRTVDNGMRRITDDSSYDTWRDGMASFFTRPRP